jgi:hypothetical protein
VLPGNAFPLTAATTVVPMTPEVQAVIRARRRWSLALTGTARKLFVLNVICGIVGLMVFLSSSYFLGSVVFGVMIVMLSLLLKSVRRAQLARDARAATYLRTSGPVVIEDKNADDESDTVVVRVGTTQFALWEYSQVAAVLKSLAWASVDYTRHARLILSITDATEGTVYREHG